MRAYISKIKSLLGVQTSEITVCEVSETSIISDATLIPESDGYVLDITFAERINDGNQIQGLSLLSDGKSVHRDGLYPGETQYQLQFDGFDIAPADYEIVFTDDEEQVVETAELELMKVKKER